MLMMFSRARDMAAEAPMGASKRWRSGVTTRMLLGGTATQSIGGWGWAVVGSVSATGLYRRSVGDGWAQSKHRSIRIFM